MNSSRHCFLCALLLLVVATLPAFAQRLTLARVDTSRYPELHAFLYVLDAAGKPITGLSAGDFVVTENGVQRQVVSLTCPPPEEPTAISSVLTIDVSGSMAWSAKGAPENPNIALARAAASAWVDALPSGSDCALSTFDDGSLIHQDFTDNKSRLLESILTLQPNGGTSYNAGLIAEPAGALPIAAGGEHKRVVVFLTDGRGGGNENAIVDAALKLNTTIFCVTLGMPAPDVLRNIAHRTGGEFFENVTTVEEAQGIYRAILYRALGGRPCEIVWRGEPSCTIQRTATITVPSRSLTSSLDYTAPALSIPRLAIDPPSLAFGRLAAGETRELSVMLTAIGQPVTVRELRALGPGRTLTLESVSVPFTLAVGEQRRLAVRLNATDTNFTFSRWEFRTDACNNSLLYASAGSGRSTQPPIHLVVPNGGEVFRAGTETLVRWEGIAPGDTVRLDYSTDAGKSWRMVAPAASGLAYRWRVPPTPSTTCLMRVAQQDDTASSGERIVKEGSKVFALSPDGSRVAGETGEKGEGISIWSVEDGRELWKFKGALARYEGLGSMVHSLEFTRDGKKLLAETHDHTTMLIDIASGRIERSFNGGLLNQPGNNFADNVSPFSPDGSRIVLASNDNGMIVYDLRTGRQIAKMVNGHGMITNAQFTPDGKTVVSAETDGTGQLWNASTGALIRTIRTSADIRATVPGPDGSLIATVADRPDDTLRLWSYATGEPLLRIPVGASASDHIPLFTPDGNYVMIWRNEVPMLADVRTGDVLMRFAQDDRSSRRRNTAMYATFSPDGTMLATYGFGGIDVWDTRTGQKITEFEHKGNTIGMQVRFTADGGSLVWSYGERLEIGRIVPNLGQQDRSDNLWSIVVDGRAASMNVDFGRRAVGIPVDSLVRRYIRNDGGTPLMVSDIAINGGAGRDFELVSGIPPFEIAPGDVHAVEFRFTPSTTGERSASVAISSSAGVLTQSLRGEGVRQQLRVEAKEVDFDSVEVGSVRDTTVTVVLRNLGAAPLEIAAPQFIGPDVSQFSIVEGGGPLTLAPRASHTMTLRFSPSVPGRTSTRLAFAHNGDGGVATAELFGHGIGGIGDYVDPTTFRTIAVPNAILPKGGTFVTGIYDVLGLMAGYAFTDNVMLLAGGGVPLPDDWGGVRGSMYGAYSIGAKAGVQVADELNVAAGFQWGRSIYDQESTPDDIESTITVSTPYAAVSYGNDDTRVSATFGYAFKHHSRPLEFFDPEFDRDAGIIAIGGDYRFGNQWKICAEVLSMKTLGYIPVAVTARFFGHTYAIDAGLAYLGIGDGPGLKVAPVVSWVAVW